MLKFLHEHRGMRADIEALKAVLYETRLTMDLLIMAVAMVPADDRAGYLDEIANALPAMGLDGVTEGDAPRLVEARAAAAATLKLCAQGIRNGVSLADLARANSVGGIQ